MTTTKNAAALLPCPFCGSNSIDPKGWASANSAGPACDDCGASAGNVSNNLADNIAAWNTRATHSQPDAALERLETKMRRAAPQGVMVYADEVGVWADELATLRATLAQPDALTSQPSGEAVAWMDHFGGVVSAAMKRRDTGLLYSIPLYTHPSADAPAGVNSSLRVAALALADLAERNTDDLDLWQAAIAAVRNAADASGEAMPSVSDSMVRRFRHAYENMPICATEDDHVRAALTAALEGRT